MVLLGPTVWRRTFFLAKRQVQADLPLSLAEIRGDRDGLRAEHAVDVCRLEQKLKREIEANAEHRIMLGSYYEQLKRIPVLETSIDAVTQQLATSEAEKQEVSSERDRIRDQSDILQAELERVQHHNAAMEGLVNTLRIDVSTHEIENSRLSNEIRDMRRDRKGAAARYGELSTQVTAAQADLKSEKRRNSELQEKLEKLIAELSDAQERLERHQRLSQQGETVSEGPSDFAKQSFALREEMTQLAARMVAATAQQEGAESPILSILNDDANTKSELATSISLADRIRGLQRG